MDIKKLCSYIDHTELGVAATEKDIEALCEDAMRFGVASVCVAPAYVTLAARLLKDSAVKVCTVVGFPNGYSTTGAKCFEAREAIEKGADEIDMVINIGLLKAGKHGELIEEIKAVKEACKDKVLKVIVESCLLSDDEISTMCGIVHSAGGDFIKTSTGFSKSGATPEAVEIMAKNRPNGLKIKAAGGISSIEDAEKYIELGADRLGTSRIVKILKSLENQ